MSTTTDHRRRVGQGQQVATHCCEWCCFSQDVLLCWWCCCCDISLLCWCCSCNLCWCCSCKSHCRYRVWHQWVGLQAALHCPKYTPTSNVLVLPPATLLRASNAADAGTRSAPCPTWEWTPSQGSAYQPFTSAPLLLLLLPSHLLHGWAAASCRIAGLDSLPECATGPQQLSPCPHRP